MEMNEIYELMNKFDASESSYIKLSKDDVSLVLKKADMAGSKVKIKNRQKEADADRAYTDFSEQEAGTVTESSSAGVQETVKDDDYIKAPLVGVFYSAPSPEESAYVSVGDYVNKGDVVCLIEAMKMMNEVVAHKSGVIKSVLVENEDMVEYDTPLFVIQE